MSARVFRDIAALLALAITPLMVYLFLRVNPGLDTRLVAPSGHFQVVSAASLLAAGISVAVGLAGTRLRNSQVIFLSMGFSSLAFAFSLHGLATPGFLLKPSSVPAIAAQLSVLLTSLWLWMSSLPSDHPLVAGSARRQSSLLWGWNALLAAVVAGAMLFPQAVRLVPLNESPLKWAAAAVTLALFSDGWRRYLWAYRYSQFPLQFAILCSLGWLIVSQLIIATGTLWQLSWWIYHLLFLAATATMVLGLFRQYSVDLSMTAAVRRLFTADPADRVEAGIAPSIRAFIIATETRDRYTAGHNYRVAVMALRLGEAMGLKPEELRALAQGAVVHDVGKIEIPDQILNKPDRLTPDERTLIERHPVTGYEMCRRMGFMQEELQVLRHHHERWDGRGYPDRLAGDRIPLLARIVAVADVYDALTSARAYREPWSNEQALSYLTEETGCAFDPACVKAWIRIGAGSVKVDQYPPWLWAQGLKPGESTQ